jgi:BirA family transcriptional regulator, biotin operon repressor / biotin---[acetyl-CoA-carboxylase] ligase
MDAFSAEELYKGLMTKTLGRRAIILDTVDSTNSEVRRMLERDAAEGVVVIAGRQTGGRGRRGRRWVSEAGCGLWMSVAIRAFLPPEETQCITLAAAIAVCWALERETGGTARPVIKWPNDVLLKERKICGILCESLTGSPYPPLIRGDVAAATGRISWVVTGIGVNTCTPQGGWGEADGVAVSLEEATGLAISRLSLAARILNGMEELLDRIRAGGFAAIAEEYRHRMLPLGSEVEIVDGENRRHGRIEGLDDAGGLLVRLATGKLERIVSGEITVRGVGGYV